MKFFSALLLPLVLLATAAQDNPAKDIKSKDFETRKAAVIALSSGEHDKAEKLLIGALKDEDWELVELAAKGLGDLGETAGINAVKALIKLSLEGPVQRLRRQAAQSLALVDPVKGVDELTKKLSGKSSLPASEAILAVADAGDERNAPKSLIKAAEKGKEYATRRAATMAILTVGKKDRSENLVSLLENERAGVRAAALDTVRAAPVPGDLPAVRSVLERPKLSGVIERRALWAARAVIWTLEGDAARKKTAGDLVSALAGSSTSSAKARAPRLIAYLATPPRDTYGAYPHGKTRHFDDAWLLGQLATSLESSDANVRAAAAHALRVLDSEEARAAARDIGSQDADARVRRTALASATVEAEASDDEDEEEAARYDEVTLAWLVERMGAERDTRTREDLCVALGHKRLQAAVVPLTKALEDGDTNVAVCAAVALGKTRMAEAVAPLQRMIGHDDWKIRGAAVIGLGHTYQKNAIPALLTMLDDDETVVGRAAHEFLLAYSGNPDRERSTAAWRKWWEEKEKSIKLIDPETAEDRAKKYGYSTNWDLIYGGLDIVVLDSRGDHIQHIMNKLGVEHRLTQAAKIGEDEVHPQCVFVANCTGEIEAGDVERLAWYLRCGGYLFGSCWALHETVEKVYPGVVRKYETGEVIDLVTADNCAQDSPYLEGVFAPGVRPLYSLLGAHLIEVLDHERAEVLIDSPECAERWGVGDLATWFRAGHGVVLDSVNHFEEQGLTNAKGLKGAEAIQAYCVDHMGLTYAELRELKNEKFWKSTSKAASEVMDLSVFKLVTNFVRLKRLDGR